MNRKMRKSKNEIADKSLVEKALLEAEVLHLALSQGGQPYSVPVNFGYGHGKIYFHSGKKGLKMEMLRANPRVSFSAVAGSKPVRGETPCKWDWSYESVIGFGVAAVVEDPAEKLTGLQLITEHYAGPGQYDFPQEKADIAAVVRIDVEQMTGKKA